MRIIQLTPGTGNFHCGNCMRDNAMVNAMRRMGHDVLLVPLYLPHVVDEPSTAEGKPILFGGINVYLQQKLPIFRHTPRWLDRIFDSAGLLKWAADRAAMTTAKDLGALTVSMLAGEEGMQNKELTKLIDYLRGIMRPEVVILSNALMVGMARRITRELNCPVICTLAGEDAFLDSLIPPYRKQAWELLKSRAADVAAFVPVSRYYADVMSRRLSLPPDKVHVIHNGIDITGFGPEAAPPQPTIGFLARMCVGKGLAALIDAFILLKKRDRVPRVKLAIAGSANKADESFVHQLKQKLHAVKLDSEVTWHPNLDHAGKQDFLRGISVLSVPATYGESFGLYLLEAWASGVPVVQPRRAAFPELIERAGGGILCPPDDPAALAEALEQALLNPDETQRLGRNARRHVLQSMTVQHMAGDVLKLCEQVHRGAAAPARIA